MNIFIDAGYYFGESLGNFIKKGIVDETWTVYAFEPNPEINVNAREYPVPIIMSRKAVWVKDGKTKFWISHRENASHVDGTSSSAENKKITVPCMDFSKFVGSLPKDANIICSMDIEGAEYSVLHKMLEENTIDRISLLFIEFHDRFMGTTTVQDSQDLIDKIEARGVKIELEVPLT